MNSTLFFETYRMELSDSSASSTESEDEFEITIPRSGMDEKEILIENISKRKSDIRGCSIRIRRFKIQRDSFITMVTEEEKSLQTLITDTTKLEEELSTMIENEKSKDAKKELEQTDAWKLVDNCICGERLLHGVGEQGYGVVSFSCNCTCNRMMHFKCVLSVRGSICPWCRSCMLFGDSKKRMNNSEDNSFFDLVDR